MNPLFYKAHPLLYLTVDLAAHPSSHTLGEAVRLLLIYLASSLFFSACLWWGTRKAAGFAPRLATVFLLALAASVCYLGPMLTLLGDVLVHGFRFAERFILVFCLFVAAQMLSGLYAVSVRDPRTGRAIGLADGFALSLLLWLMSIPFCLAFLGLNAELKIL